MPLNRLHADSLNGYCPSGNLAPRRLSSIGEEVVTVRNSAQQFSGHAELEQLRQDIKHTSDALQRHQLHADYEDLRQHPLSNTQKLKDLLMRVRMAGSGHRPGHVPNRSMQQAWAAEERLAQLNQRYLPLARAEALAQMGDQLTAAEQALEALPAALAATLKPQVERFKQRYDAAKFGLAITVGRDFAQDAAPLMPLFNLGTYLGIEQAGQGIRDAVQAAQDLYSGETASRPSRLYENQSKMFAEDQQRARAAWDAQVVDAPAPSAPTTTGPTWLQQFSADARELLRRIDRALSLPGAEGAELEEVVVLLQDMVGQGRHVESGGLHALGNEVYRPTTESIANPALTEQLQSMAGALRTWLVLTGALAAQRVGNAVEQHPLLTVGALAAYGAISTVYSSWCLPADDGLIVPFAKQPEVQAQLTREQLQARVEHALDAPWPGHPHETFYDALAVLVDASATTPTRLRRDAERETPSSVEVQKVLVWLHAPSANGCSTLGSEFRRYALVPLSVADELLAEQLVKALAARVRAEEQTAERLAANLAAHTEVQVEPLLSEWLSAYKPILQPSLFIEQHIVQGIQAFQNVTGSARHYSPDTPVRVGYREILPANPNLQIRAPQIRYQTFALREVVTGTFWHDIRAKRGPLDVRYTAVSYEHQPLIDALRAQDLAGELEKSLAEYQADPRNKQRMSQLYQGQIQQRCLEYLNRHPADSAFYSSVTDFMLGKQQAAEVKFRGVTLNGVVLIPKEQGGLLFSVDDQQYFHIETKNEVYVHYGQRKWQPVPVYPDTPEFRQWVLQKLPVFQQFQYAADANAFALKKEAYHKQAHLGIPESGGKLSFLPLAFEPREDMRDLSEQLFDGLMQRLKSDIDKLVFTDGERRSLDLLDVCKAILRLYATVGAVGMGGTGGVMLGGVLGAAGMGVSHAQAAISDRPDEAAGYQQEASDYTKQVVLSAFLLAAGPAFRPAMLARGGYRTVAHIKPLLQRYHWLKYQAGRTAAKISTQLRWAQLNDAGKTQQLTKVLAGTAEARALARLVDERTLNQAIRNNLLLDGLGQSKTRFSWGRFAFERFNGQRRLASDLRRLRAVNRQVETLFKTPPVVPRQVMSGDPAAAAAEWIVGRSTSNTLTRAQVERVLRQFRHADINDPKVIDAVHAALYQAPAGQLPRFFRSSSDPVHMGSDVARAGFEKIIRGSAPSANADRLFATINRYHPYGDGNGRTARTLYALARLREDGTAFKALTAEGENLLLGLQHPATAGVAPLINATGGRAQRSRIAVFRSSDLPKHKIPTPRLRTEPVRVIEAHPSYRLPAEMQDYLTLLQRDRAIADAIAAPAGKCASLMEPVARFMKAQGMTDIKYRGMFMFNNMAEEKWLNHFVVVGSKQGKPYVFDLTATQFANKGMPALDKPLILPEAAWADLYRSATTRKLIKYKDFSSSQRAEQVFNPQPPVQSPTTFIEDANILHAPSWYTQLG